MKLRNKRWVLWIVLFVALLSFVGCELDTYNESSEGSEHEEAPMFFAYEALETPNYATSSNINNQTNVPISQWITVSL